MCTVVILRRSGHAWPVLIGANRDEMIDRTWSPPDRHWPDREEVTAGLDQLAGGSWLGKNDHGVVAAILNRTGSLGPSPDKRSRGELVLEALDHADAVDAAKAFADLASDAYRPFNMVIADNRDAYWVRSTGDAIDVQEIPEGFSMLTALERNDRASPRIAAHLDAFLAAPHPDVENADWAGWVDCFSNREAKPANDPTSAMNINPIHGFGTVSSSLIALPTAGDIKPIWLFAAGRPDEAPYQPVT
jgi:uncharacterized protein with NRDE domain